MCVSEPVSLVLEIIRKDDFLMAFKSVLDFFKINDDEDYEDDYYEEEEQAAQENQ